MKEEKSRIIAKGLSGLELGLAENLLFIITRIFEIEKEEIIKNNTKKREVVDAKKVFIILMLAMAPSVKPIRLARFLGIHPSGLSLILLGHKNLLESNDPKYTGKFLEVVNEFPIIISTIENTLKNRKLFKFPKKRNAIEESLRVSLVFIKERKSKSPLGL